ncbi:MAG: tetratricopeptide repeat protein [Nitrospirota bacterium]
MGLLKDYMDLGKKDFFSADKIKLYIAFLVLVSLLLYAVTLRNGFVWDSELVIKDPTIKDLKYLPSYFTEDTLANQRKDNPGSVYVLKYYRPLLKVFYLFEYKAFGMNPMGYNAVNILLNAAVVALCFILVLDITGNIRIAFLSSLIYAVNPARVEAVSWFYSVSIILMALFCLLSLIFYHRRKYISSLISFIAALFVRESAVLFPLILILYEFLIHRQRSARGYLKIIYFFFFTGVYLAARQAVAGPPPLTDLDLFTLFNSISVIIKRYVKIFFITDAPVTAYQMKLFNALDPEVVISYFLLAGLLTAGALIWLKKREYLFWYIWFFVWIAMSFNIGKFADYMMAEKELYLASLGFSVLLAEIAVNLPVRKIIAHLLLAGFITAHFGISFSRNFFWRDSVTYLEKLLQFAPDFYLPHYALANYYASGKEFDKAFDEFRKTVILFPKYSMAYNNMGNIYYLKGLNKDALAMWEKAIGTDPANPQPYYNIGLVLEKRGDLEQSLNYYRKYLSIASDVSPDILKRINELEKIALPPTQIRR